MGRNHLLMMGIFRCHVSLPESGNSRHYFQTASKVWWKTSEHAIHNREKDKLVCKLEFSLELSGFPHYIPIISYYKMELSPLYPHYIPIISPLYPHDIPMRIPNLKHLSMSDFPPALRWGFPSTSSSLSGWLGLPSQGWRARVSLLLENCESCFMSLVLVCNAVGCRLICTVCRFKILWY